MIKGGNATVYVSDMTRAIDFYTRSLGLKLRDRFGDQWASIDAGDGLLIGLHPAGPKTPTPGASGATMVGLGLTQPIEQVVDELRRRGVVFRGPVVSDGPMKLAFLADPDGNTLYLCQYAQWGS